MSTITSSIQKSWHSWNQVLENSSTATFKAACRILPISVQQNETEAKLFIHALISAVWLQATVGNHFIPFYLACPLAIAGTLTNVQPLLANGYKHCNKFNTFSNLQKIASVAFLVLCISTQFGVTYLSGICENGKNKRYVCFSLNLWFAFGGLASSVIFNSVINRFNDKTPSEEGVETIKRLPKQDYASWDKVSEYVASKTKKFHDEIIELKAKIKKIEHFIRERPDLAQICEQRLSEDLANDLVVIPSKCDMTDFDPNNPNHEMGRLGVERNNLENKLSEQIRFIKRHPEIYQMFLSYLNEGSQEDNQLLLYRG